MKTSRNDTCPCGSGKKYKNCCDKKGYQSDGDNRLVRWIISAAVGSLLIIFVWGILEFFTTDHPEMEAYKCDNPACNQIHYRPATQSK